MRIFFWLFLSLFFLIFLLPIVCWVGIELYANSHIYTDTTEISGYDTALLLGTSPHTNGRRNVFFSTRIQAMSDLF